MESFPDYINEPIPLIGYPRLNEDQCIVGDCIGTYENLIPLYNTTYRINCSGKEFDCHEFPSPTWARYGRTINREIMYTGVLPTRKTIMSSMMKCDVKPIKNLQRPDLFDQVINDLKYAFEPHFNTGPDFMPSFTMASSSAFPFPQISNCKTKEDILSKPWFHSEYVDNPFDKTTWWRAIPKHEFLTIYDIKVNGKIRTFMPAPLHLLYWQKTFFGPQDENLKNQNPMGIRYGIDFHHGGFDNLIKSHYYLRCLDPIKDLYELVFMECDISGWDRRLSVMKEIYEIRTAFIKCPSEFRSKLAWTIKNVLESKILLPNGDVVQKVGASNCSGSGTTTTDNCIGHVIINEYADALMKAIMCDSAFEYTEMDFKTWCDIYGDDILKSFSIKLWDFLKDGSFIKELYLQFNMIVKDSAFRVQKGPIGMTFLGAKVVLFDNYFLPAYCSDRIYTALCLNIEDPGKSPDVEATKAYSLMMLAWNDIPLFNAIREYLLNMLRDSSIHGPFLSSLVKRGLPSRMEVIYSFWLNVEGIDTCYSLLSQDGGRVLKEVVQQCNSFKQIRHYNGDGIIQTNEVRNDKSSILGEA
jgi:hypothetical protein